MGERIKTNALRVFDRSGQYDKTRPLRIGFYSPSLPESGTSNGIVTYVRIMRDALRSLGHEVMIVTNDHAETFAGETIELPRPNSLAYRLRCITKPHDGAHPWAKLRVIDAHKFAIANGVDIFEIEETFGWSRYLRGPVITRIHGPSVLSGEGSKARNRAELRALSRFVTCPSQRLLSTMRLSAQMARAIPNPIEIPREQWSIPNHTQILCVGRNDARKGADLVLTAFARARKANPDLTLTMVGPGFDVSVQQDGVTFLGPQPAERLAELRARSAFCVVGSRFECFPYSIGEAMALGMPVLASDTFGNAELIRDGLDGLIFPVGDAAAMASAILVMSSDPYRLSSMGEHARNRARDWLCPKRIALQTISFFWEALSRY